MVIFASDELLSCEFGTFSLKSKCIFGKERGQVELMLSAALINDCKVRV